MKKNMGTTDKAARILIAVAITGFYFENLISGTVAIILLIIAEIFIITSFAGYCPLHLPFRISTRKKAE